MPKYNMYVSKKVNLVDMKNEDKNSNNENSGD